MKQSLPKRKDLRLENYDYSQPGWYYITVCVQDRKCLFGEIKNGKMALNDMGLLVKKYWNKLIDKFNIELDEYIIMPNHIHGIIVINNNNGRIHVDINGRTRVDDNGRTHGSAPTINHIHPMVGVDPCVDPHPSLGETIQWFKTMTTNQYIKNVKNDNWPPFDKRIWQRNYHEHIIRNETELNKIQKYITNNAAMWENDKND